MQKLKPLPQELESIEKLVFDFYHVRLRELTANLIDKSPNDARSINSALHELGTRLQTICLRMDRSYELSIDLCNLIWAEATIYTAPPTETDSDLTHAKAGLYEPVVDFILAVKKQIETYASQKREPVVESRTK